MAMLVQRSTSALSVEYLSPRQDNSMMDAEICRLFGSLNLTTPTYEDRQIAAHDTPTVFQAEEDTSMAVQSDMNAISDAEGNVQVSPQPSRPGYPFLEIYEPKQFIESIPSAPEAKPEDLIEGCGLIQVLAAHYAPRLSHLHCATRDPDFNLLETILAHREQFVSFPYGHRTCSGALTKIAFEIERRNNAGQPYHDDPDVDIADALHNEAWLMSGWYHK